MVVTEIKKITAAMIKGVELNAFMKATLATLKGREGLEHRLHFSVMRNLGSCCEVPRCCSFEVNIL